MSEQKDVWDKLWKEADIHSITEDSNLSWQWVRNILFRIKDEGDKLKEKAAIFDAWEEGRCGYFKPGYGCDSPTGIGNSVMCRRIPDCEVLTEEGFWKQVKAARNKLYEDLPTGDVDAFDLLKVVQSHIAKLDAILGDS